jgi:hypothetical protein
MPILAQDVPGAVTSVAIIGADIVAFVQTLHRLIPDLRSEDLIAAGSGVRAQALAINGRLIDDFSHQLFGLNRPREQCPPQGRIWQSPSKSSRDSALK